MDDMDKTKTSCDLNGHKKINAMYAGIVSRKVSRLNFPEATYFEILYFDAAANEWHCGFGSFTLCFVEDWLKAEFEPTYKRLDTAITDLLARAEAAEARAEKAEREMDEAIQYMRKTFGWCTGCVHFTGIYGSGCKIGEMSTCGEENNHYVFCKGG